MTASSEETGVLARALSSLIHPGMTILLEGPLGSGKTTFTQHLGQSLGIRRAIKSPTYTIVKEYPLENHQQLIHIDAYRLEEGGADSIDLDSYLTDDSLVLVEWAEFLGDYLPETYLQIVFRPQENLHHREITITAHGPQKARYEAIIDQLEECQP